MSFWRKLVIFVIVWTFTVYIAVKIGMPNNLFTSLVCLTVPAIVVVLLSNLKERRKK